MEIRIRLGVAACMILASHIIWTDASADPTTPSAVCFSDADHYRTTGELYASLDTLASQFPALAEVVDYGDSYKKTIGGIGFDLKALRITNRQTTSVKPIAVFVTGYHGDELPPTEVLMRFAHWLLAGYNRHADATWVIDQFEIWIIPVVNPDRYQRSRTNARGVDLNRNHSFQWVAKGTLHGSGPASEPEVRAIETLLSRLFIDRRGPNSTDPAAADTAGIFVTIHSPDGKIAYPWGYTTARAPNHDGFSAIAARLSRFNGYRAGQANPFIAFLPGSAQDWVYGMFGVPAFLLEFDFAKKPPYQTIDSHYWPRHRDALLYLITIARTPYLTVQGPELSTLLLTQAAGGYRLSTVADDSQSGGQSISKVEYFIDIAPWRTGARGVAMQAKDGNFNSTIEAASTLLSTQGLSATKHIVFVRATDAVGNHGPARALFLNLAPNNPPQFVRVSPTGSISTKIYRPVSFSVSTRDADGQVVNLAWSVDGRLLKDCAAESFTYLPTNDEIGNHEISVHASDGTAIVDHRWQLSVVNDPSVAETVVDDADPRTKRVGTWTKSTAAGYWGAGSVYATSSGKTFSWLPSLPRIGQYFVYAHWTYHIQRGPAVPYDIVSDGGTTRVIVNQSDPALGGRWNLLGSFHLTPGQNGNVTMTTEGGQANADAIKWVAVGSSSTLSKVVVDNQIANTARTDTRIVSTNPKQGVEQSACDTSASCLRHRYRDAARFTYRGRITRTARPTSHMASSTQREWRR